MEVKTAEHKQTKASLYIATGLIAINLLFHVYIWTLFGGVKANYSLYEAVSVALYVLGLSALGVAVFLHTKSYKKAIAYPAMTYLLLPLTLLLIMAVIGM